MEPDKAKAWCILGKYYLGQKELAKSISPLKKCKTIDPSVENLLNYGIALFDYSNIDVAKTMYIFNTLIHLVLSNYTHKSL